MNVHRPFTRLMALVLCGLTFVSSLHVTVAQAAMVSTQELVRTEQLDFDRTHLHALLEREQAIKAMQSMGVDPVMVQQRVAQMTEDELRAFNEQVDQMQAGSGALGVVVLVFLVLILLDLLGATDIFPAIRPINTR